MNKNIELFIKYLDKQLTLTEREKFEAELSNDVDLEKEFKQFSELYNSTKNNVDVDERYFSTLLPNAKIRIEKSKPNYFGKIVYALPVVIIIMYLIISPFTNKKFNEKYNFEEFTEEFVLDENLAISALSNAFEPTENYTIEDLELLEFYEKSSTIDEAFFDYVEENLSFYDIDKYILAELTENEYVNLLEELESNKIYRGIK